MEQTMESALFSALSCIILLSATVLSMEAKAEGAYEPRLDKDGWELLFDGKDLNAWDAQPGVWTISEQGELTPAKGGQSLFTKRRYCDYALELDFKVAANKKSNSGVFLRTHNLNDPVNTGMEIQVLDDAAYNVKWDAMNANGALYDLVRPSVSASNPPEEWNHFTITVNDGALTVELNGKEIVKADLNLWVTPKQNPDGTHNKFTYAIGSLPREGFIGLQNYGGVPVWYRNIRLKPLSDRKAQFTGKEPIDQVLKKPEGK
jgi:hypothetical protein